jgi:hypothetical protein
MKSVEALRTLKAELRADMPRLERLFHKYELIHDKISKIEPDEFDYVALAYTIVNLYNLIENYFLRISKTFENDLDPTTWHKHLLQRMYLEIEGLRPAFMTEQDYINFNEIRAFRHVFRHIYQQELDITKLIQIDSFVPATIKRFEDLHQGYLEKLDVLIQHIEALET